MIRCVFYESVPDRMCVIREVSHVYIYIIPTILCIIILSLWFSTTLVEKRKTRYLNYLNIKPLNSIKHTSVTDYVTRREGIKVLY